MYVDYEIDDSSIWDAVENEVSDTVSEMLGAVENTIEENLSDKLVDMVEAEYTRVIKDAVNSRFNDELLETIRRCVSCEISRVLNETGDRLAKEIYTRESYGDGCCKTRNTIDIEDGNNLC